MTTRYWRGAKCRPKISSQQSGTLAYVTADRTTTSCIDIGKLRVHCFDPNTITLMRAILDEAAGELHIPTTSSALRAKMAETILRKASFGASREKAAALQAGRLAEI